jgi:ribosomal protein S18 acetylase RimI-like enzyme
LISVERARDIRYDTASLSGCTVGVIGVFFDPMGETTELEPSQITDMALVPEYRRRGVARAQIDAPVGGVRSSGHDRLGRYTDGNSLLLPSFYNRLGFGPIAIVPDWGGDGTAKVMLRRDLR